MPNPSKPEALSLFYHTDTNRQRQVVDNNDVTSTPDSSVPAKAARAIAQDQSNLAAYRHQAEQTLTLLILAAGLASDASIWEAAIHHWIQRDREATGRHDNSQHELTGTGPPSMGPPASSSVGAPPSTTVGPQEHSQEDDLDIVRRNGDGGADYDDD